MEIAKHIFRLFARSKWIQISVATCLLVSIYCFYNFNSKSSFSEISQRYHQSEISVNQKKDVVVEENVSGKVTNSLQTDKKIHKDTYIDVLITFTKAENNYALQEKFKTTVSSLLKWSTIPVNLHILGDPVSYQTASKILSEVADKNKYKVIQLNIDELAKQVHAIISEMQKYFSYKPGAYYSDSLFFLSLAIHKVLPSLHRVIMLDADLKFNADIKDLFAMFDQFTSENIIGLGRDTQPVYRHMFHMYRNALKDTRVGAPPPDGLTGFNSGVMLLDLDKMRESTVYNSLLTPESVKALTEKYLFKGHLGDQDFFSLISLDYENLFFVLPCTWNRQLCQWWRGHGYEEVFDQYFTCEGHINIYHGNCNTPIPKLEWEN